MAAPLNWHFGGPMIADKILFVDDEPAILDGYRRLLYPSLQ
jgi:hypothetical protein